VSRSTSRFRGLNVARCRWRIGFLLLVFSAAGCVSEIETGYGQRRGPGASGSVNGTAVLAEMFEQAGHEVFSWSSLSPRLTDHADCIVWFPDDFQPPAPQVRWWLEDWLRNRSRRTLIYVGRDFDAAAGYWEKIEPDTPADQLAEVRRRKTQARHKFQTRRGEIPTGENCQWFIVDGRWRPRKVCSLQGDPQWLRDVDPSKLEIQLNSRIRPTEYTQVLLESEGDMLVSRERVPMSGSRLIVVANGSFLLNLPLVNRQHRKLAGKLIEEVGPPGQTVAFLESGPGGPPILAEDPAVEVPTGVEMALTPPLCWLFLHLAIVGVAFCFSRWPVFGLPRQLDTGVTSDFGKHIEALGDLLRRSRDRAYAMARVLHYQQVTKGSE